MRFGLIADIHANLPALELVLAELEAARVDQIVCLGDVASLGPQPREVIARLRQQRIPVIQGNHDAYLLNLELAEPQAPWLRAVEAWTQAQLTAGELDFLRALPAQLSFALGADQRLLCFHGSPRSNEEWLFPTTSAELLDEAFRGCSDQVWAGGHTHVQMLRPHREAWLINPGSVGMPFEFPMRGGSPRSFPAAEYAVVEWADGRLTTQLCRRPIDFDAVARAAHASGLPEVEHWLSAWGV